MDNAFALKIDRLDQDIERRKRVMKQNDVSISRLVFFLCLSCVIVFGLVNITGCDGGGGGNAVNTMPDESA